jgi:hypothetical protein
VAAPVVTGPYWIVTGDGRSTEELVQAGGYGYAHSCVISENFPVRSPRSLRRREVLLVQFDREVTSEQALTAAAGLGLRRPTPEDALQFGVQYSEAQREGPVVFLHEPWFGYFGRRDVLCLWTNAGRRELGLEDFDGRWAPGYRFAFVGRDEPVE